MVQLLHSLSSLCILAAVSVVNAATGGAAGSPVGFALNAGVTGGGSATAATPSDTAQLISWLQDDVARVIVSLKEWAWIFSYF
jgi:pectin lyase